MSCKVVKSELPLVGKYDYHPTLELAVGFTRTYTVSLTLKLITQQIFTTMGDLTTPYMYGGESPIMR